MLDERLDVQEARGRRAPGRRRLQGHARARGARDEPVGARIPPEGVASHAVELDGLVGREGRVSVAGDEDGLLDAVGEELEPGRIDGRREPRGHEGRLPDAHPALRAHDQLDRARARQRKLLRKLRVLGPGGP